MTTTPNNTCELLVQKTKGHLTAVQGEINLISALLPTAELPDARFVKYTLRRDNPATIAASELLADKGFLHFLVAPDFSQYEHIDTGVRLYYIENEALYHKPVPADVLLLKKIEEIKENVIKTAGEYAKSAAVDGCIVGGKTIVFNGSLRQKIANRLANESAAGHETVTLIFDGIEYTNTVTLYQQMLLQINLRADRNFDNYQRHLKNIKTLDTEAALKTYNYKSGYEAPLVLM